MWNGDDRTSIKIVIVAAILVLIVVAAVNSQSLMRAASCGVPYVASLCAAPAPK